MNTPIPNTNPTMNNDPDHTIVSDALSILNRYTLVEPQVPLKAPHTPIPYTVATTVYEGPLEGPESPFEVFRGEGWCDDVLLPPPGPPVPPCSEGPAAPGDPAEQSGGATEGYPGDESLDELRQDIPPLASRVERTIRVTGELPACFRPSSHM
jgi:hypothetical protein